MQKLCINNTHKLTSLLTTYNSPLLLAPHYYLALTTQTNFQVIFAADNFASEIDFNFQRSNFATNFRPISRFPVSSIFGAKTGNWGAIDVVSIAPYLPSALVRPPQGFVQEVQRANGKRGVS
ncbi:hypothetical protein [Burkholderia sp. Bp9140]|uniref:hypothetical protein n=1 Tax=Burkholderia sp. Bp9140 TaxID=2184572 RepID=UPI001627BB23|nr:hypothetical protein [Burkholderia sp. Bp9140]